MEHINSLSSFQIPAVCYYDSQTPAFSSFSLNFPSYLGKRWAIQIKTVACGEIKKKTLQFKDRVCTLNIMQNTKCISTFLFVDVANTHSKKHDRENAVMRSESCWLNLLFLFICAWLRHRLDSLIPLLHFSFCYSLRVFFSFILSSIIKRDY